jgi:hypothetical protein
MSADCLMKSLISAQHNAQKRNWLCFDTLKAAMPAVEIFIKKKKEIPE